MANQNNKNLFIVLSFCQTEEYYHWKKCGLKNVARIVLHYITFIGVMFSNGTLMKMIIV